MHSHNNYFPLVLQSFKTTGANNLDPYFTQYRRAVLRGKDSSSDFWIMAERVIREYSG